jgi:hypothetical protein
MTNKLRVIEPFYNLETGDELELSKDGKNYVFEVSESNASTSDSGSTNNASFSAKFTISVDYAKQLVKDGYLEEETEREPDFKNIFTEIDNLISTYGAELKNIDNEFANQPACLKVEKQTVLNNMIKVLSHLRGLKK